MITSDFKTTKINYFKVHNSYYKILYYHYSYYFTNSQLFNINIVIIKITN